MVRSDEHENQCNQAPSILYWFQRFFLIAIAFQVGDKLVQCFDVIIREKIGEVW